MLVFLRARLTVMSCLDSHINESNVIPFVGSEVIATLKEKFTDIDCSDSRGYPIIVKKHKRC